MSCLGNGRSNRSISSYARTLRVWFFPFEQIRCVLPDMLGPHPIVPCALDHLSERAFYTDSDSVLFTESPDDPSMDPFRIILLLFTLRRGRGPRLHHVILCRIPKNYGYKTAKGNTMCKVRDFSLDVEGATQLNYKVLKDHTLDEIQNPKPDPHVTPIVQSHTIYRNAKRYISSRREQLARNIASCTRRGCWSRIFSWSTRTNLLTYKTIGIYKSQFWVTGLGRSQVEISTSISVWI